jgi:Prenyltransferase and squalene oxidase repeat
MGSRSMKASRQSRIVGVLFLTTLVCASPLWGAPPGPVLPEMVSRETVRAVDRGMTYLVKTQRGNGSWLNQGGYGTYPAVMTSLSGLAMMAGGSTPETGPYARNVAKAMNYVLRVAESREDGLIVGPGAEARSMYGHGFSMLFLAQCYGMEISPPVEDRIRTVLDKAVALTVRSQSDLDQTLGQDTGRAGGWIYTPTGRSDEGSVTVTQLQALRACRNAGIRVPRNTIDRAVAYLKFCQMPDGGICYSAQRRTSSRPAISAAAIACFYAAGVYDRPSGGAGEEAEMVERLVRFCQPRVRADQSSSYFFYGHLYMAQAMYQRSGKDWSDYYPAIRDRMLQLQNPDGSWSGDSWGTTYGTAIASIVLQLPYGYLPVFER